MFWNRNSAEETMKIRLAAIGLGIAIALGMGAWPQDSSAYPKCHVADCQQLPGTHSRDDVKASCEGAGIEYGQNAHSGSYGCVDRANGQGWIQCDSTGHCIAGGARASGDARDPRTYLGRNVSPADN